MKTQFLALALAALLQAATAHAGGADAPSQVRFQVGPMTPSGDGGIPVLERGVDVGVTFDHGFGDGWGPGLRAMAGWGRDRYGQDVSTIMMDVHAHRAWLFDRSHPYVSIGLGFYSLRYERTWFNGDTSRYSESGFGLPLTLGVEMEVAPDWDLGLNTTYHAMATNIPLWISDARWSFTQSYVSWAVTLSRPLGASGPAR
jgi:outer membrane protein W